MSDSSKPNTRKGNGWHGKLYGRCPVQGDGEIDGHLWFFRARGSIWSFEVIGFPETNKTYPWGKWPDAGNMPEDVAWKHIIESLESFRVLGGTKSDSTV